ncbi:putative transcription factor MYB-HB-like family [Helianthus annuus]|uniref:Homeobox-like domain superfamily protein n=2 Tax=Helianthus annuus TaxID=4232 RepID=A0A9K3N9L4_HELAN|nr:putative Homeobox-like domain superfamily protein [Helianthus annuus]KAJ0527424.1 putative transcription factor MYB-HB-like family [Helianthus annuus]KAJ0536133.1 putative transcription factor MYB-HB-like family [Helianthus annuus]KAJ0543827.1 putative transcription factor MYB-HB-like family [Helianthus annuus]KAJ0708881.1 putative transcription factor MYB-HB-like family [Helianthus annuus]
MASDSTLNLRQQKLFENALAVYDKDTPDRWQNIAKATGMTVNEVIRQYRLLIEDVAQIESGKVPLPKYKTSGAKSFYQL